MPSKFPLYNLFVVETKRRNLHQLDPYLGLICSTFCCIFLFSSRNGPSGERRIPQLKIIGRMDRTISFSSLLKGLQKNSLSLGRAVAYYEIMIHLGIIGSSVVQFWKINYYFLVGNVLKCFRLSIIGSNVLQFLKGKWRVGSTW